MLRMVAGVRRVFPAGVAARFRDAVAFLALQPIGSRRHVEPNHGFAAAVLLRRRLAIEHVEWLRRAERLFMREQRCEQCEADEWFLRHSLPQKNFRTPMKKVRRGPYCGAATPMPCWARMR